MKNHIQTIINVCFAISVTLLIYQNTQLKERLSTLDLATLEMSIENDITLAKLKNDVESNFEMIGLFKQMQDDTNVRFIKVMSANEVNIDIAFENIDLAETSRLENRIAIKNMEDYLIDNFGK